MTPAAGPLGVVVLREVVAAPREGAEEEAAPPVARKAALMAAEVEEASRAVQKVGVAVGRWGWLGGRRGRRGL